MARTNRWLDRNAALAAATLIGLAIALSVLAAGQETFPLDQRLGEWVRGWGEAFEPVADWLNAHNIEFAVGAWLAGAATAVALRRWDVATLFALALPLRLALLPLKSLVDRPRPSGDFAILADFDGSSFPSGHVLTTAAALGLWFALAGDLLPRRLVWPARALAVSAVVLAALARVWAGVHWPSDTYGAAIWSAASVALLLAIRPGVARLVQRRGARSAGDGSRERQAR